MSSKYCCTRTDCVYHPHKGPDKGTCDYMVITRKRRGCPIVGCTRYRSGKRQRTGTGIQPILDPVEKKAAEEAKKKAQAIFGENLKAAIAKKYKSQRQFAIAVGIDSTNINIYCRGKAIPKKKRMAKLCELLEVTEEELRGETDGCKRSPGSIDPGKRRSGERSQRDTGECHGDLGVGTSDPEKTDQKRR